MKIFLLSLQLFISCRLFAQIYKPPLDTGAFSKWYSIQRGSISEKGDYVFYFIYNDSARSQTLVVRAVKDAWGFEMTNAAKAQFVENDRSLIFERHDSLCLLQLGSNNIEWIPNVKSYKVWGEGNEEYLICLLNSDKHKLIVRNLVSNLTKEFLFIKDYLPDKDNRTILLDILTNEKNSLKEFLGKVDIKGFILDTVWSSKDTSEELSLRNVTLDTGNRQAAFAIRQNERTEIWYYSDASKKSFMLADDSLMAADSSLSIEAISEQGFSHDGQRLFITLKPTMKPLLNPPGIGVDIWNYKDYALQSQQLYDLKHFNAFAHHYTAVLSIPDRRIIRLNYDFENTVLFKGKDDSLACVSSWGKGSSTERNWNPASKPSYFLVSTRTGNRRKIDFSFGNMSRAGKYLYGFDPLYQQLSIYNLCSGKYNIISQRLPAFLRWDEDYDDAGPRIIGLEIAGWMPEDSVLLLYDKYDIWAVDPLGKKLAINITRGFGRLHKIKLRFIGNYQSIAFFQSDSTYILSAFNEQTKESGFFSLCLKNSETPKLLSMGPYLYEGPYAASIDGNWLQIDQHSVYMVRRESASQSPNYFSTRDFKTFHPISDVYPERKYNWLTSEVINWETSEKNKLSGVLYKPENFDKRKKYPVIINYYEKLSGNANKYHRPQFSGDNINIPWFASRGYIVFTPDISYKKGYPGRSAYNSVVSGTKFIMKYKWVDAKKIGIQGHSWGGFETNYLISHTNLYCAALSASSISDAISDYSSLMKTGETKQFFYELTQCRIGATPWQKLDLYIENSPVLEANKINTPLLMMNNEEDPVVAFAQGVELFTALRRLGKKAWMLQYDGEAHSVGGKAAIDYTIRMTQFFDHYCMGSPAPRWMTSGVPALLKGVDSGLELDK